MVRRCYIVTDVDYESERARVIDIFDSSKVDPRIMIAAWERIATRPSTTGESIYGWAHDDEKGWSFYA